jgi:DNA repair exonuclease SbcCD ATPase subunit
MDLFQTSEAHFAVFTGELDLSADTTIRIIITYEFAVFPSASANREKSFWQNRSVMGGTIWRRALSVNRMSTPRLKLRLPQIEKVTLRRFSLFTANPDAEFTCSQGVICLVGANGIGKSTLLSAINFCLTGIVGDPNRAFESMEEYYRFSRDFSGRYFKGRIDGSDEEDAEIAIQFRLGKFRYEIRRGMFEPDELRVFTIRNSATNAIVLGTEEEPRGERHQLYASRFVEDSGLSSFEEFVFLQHFVFSFDEQRKTLFWNQHVLERALYRAFGLEAGMAKRADNLRREIQQEDSKVRNRQWEITRKSKRINEILAKTQDVTGAKERYDSLMGDYESLTRQFSEEEKVCRELADAVKNANMRLADLAVRESALREEYALLFEQRFKTSLPLAQQPLITQSLDEKTCGLCGNNSSHALQCILEKAKASTCPLCNSAVRKETVTTDGGGRLQKIDKDLAATKKAIHDVLKTIAGLRPDDEKARKSFNSTKAKLDEFDRQNNATLASLRQSLNLCVRETTLDIYREELAALELEKQTAYDLREELKAKLSSLQKTLEREYLKAEKIFVPRFAELANRFLGMPLTVQMDAREAVGLNLIVSVRGSPRPLQQQLSESQRFFLDIALRMALTDYMSDPTSRGGMFIDTPEGSLDIAYEKRAGDMLAMFAEAGHRIIMTANINSSQMLLALARRCGKKGMQLCRMTSWAELSDVQKEEEVLFNKAFQDIEQAMEPIKHDTLKP